jgi:DNA repair exonuclease SbcCD nuclease subunit
VVRVHNPGDRDNPKARQSKIKDAKVIALCLKHRYLMLTRDHEMKCTHVELLKGTDIAVVAIANNHDHHDVWIEALRIAKAKILRDFKKYQRPYFSILQKNGTVTTKTIGDERLTRRARPKEQAADA